MLLHMVLPAMSASWSENSKCKPRKSWRQFRRRKNSVEKEVRTPRPDNNLIRQRMVAFGSQVEIWLSIVVCSKNGMRFGPMLVSWHRRQMFRTRRSFSSRRGEAKGSAGYSRLAVGSSSQQNEWTRHSPLQLPSPLAYCCGNVLAHGERLLGLSLSALPEARHLCQTGHKKEPTGSLLRHEQWLPWQVRHIWRKVPVGCRYTGQNRRRDFHVSPWAVWLASDVVYGSLAVTPDEVWMVDIQVPHSTLATRHSTQPLAKLSGGSAVLYGHVHRAGFAYISDEPVTLTFIKQISADHKLSR